jgi:hypothetical protein
MHLKCWTYKNEPGFPVKSVEEFNEVSEDFAIDYSINNCAIVTMTGQTSELNEPVEKARAYTDYTGTYEEVKTGSYFGRCLLCGNEIITKVRDTPIDLMNVLPLGMGTKDPCPNLLTLVSFYVYEIFSYDDGIARLREKEDYVIFGMKGIGYITIRYCFEFGYVVLFSWYRSDENVTQDDLYPRSYIIDISNSPIESTHSELKAQDIVNQLKWHYLFTFNPKNKEE